MTNIKQYPLAETFGVAAKAGAMIPGMEPGQPGVPASDTNYVFDIDRLRELAMFWISGFRAMMIEGDPSAGKTSLVAQFHARLHWPMELVSCSPSTENWHLIGQLMPGEDGQLRWQDGPVTRACRLGISVVLDEYNVMDPAAATALNALMEGYEVVIPETGERIKPHRLTRFFVTQNSVDSRAQVAGRNSADVANEDRFTYMQVDYLRPELETALVERSLLAGKGITPEQAKNLAQIAVTTANAVRRAFREGEGGIDKPLSTRAVLRWVRLSVLYTAALREQGKSGVHYALPRAVRMSPTMAKACNEVLTAIAGFDENLKAAR